MNLLKSVIKTNVTKMQSTIPNSKNTWMDPVFQNCFQYHDRTFLKSGSISSYLKIFHCVWEERIYNLCILETIVYHSISLH